MESLFCKKLYNRIPAELFSFTSFAVGSHPDAVELFGGVFYEITVGAEDASFEVAGVFAFHAEASAGEVGGAYVGGF